MTNDPKSAELTAAVERLRRVKAGEDMATVYHREHGQEWIQKQDDERTIVNAYLATVAADEDVEKAIAIVEESRRSHETWIEWFRLHPDDEAKHDATCGDTAWHRQCIDGYDFVLKVLRASGVRAN